MTDGNDRVLILKIEETCKECPYILFRKKVRTYDTYHCRREKIDICLVSEGVPKIPDWCQLPRVDEV